MSHSTSSAAFDTELCTRNNLLAQKAGLHPSFTKTGTTIVGLIYEDGVVLGADTRSTAGTTVADKNCEKIHYIAPNIYCCGAGTAADTENVTGMISSQLELHRYATGKGSRVNSAMTLLKSHLFKYQGYISAALVLGGVDCKGPQVCIVDGRWRRARRTLTRSLALPSTHSCSQSTRTGRRTRCRTVPWGAGA